MFISHFKIKLKNMEMTKQFWSHCCLQDYSTFPIYETIPFCTLRETGCIPYNVFDFQLAQSFNVEFEVKWNLVDFSLCVKHEKLLNSGCLI